VASVFVSHSSGDDDVVAHLVADLRAANHTIWVDHSSLLAGGSIAGTIQTGIEGSDAFLLLFSRSAAKSRWVELEWQAALSRNLADDDYLILLVRLDDVDVPLLLASKKWIDLSSGYDKALQTIEAALGPVAPVRSDRPAIWYFDDSPEAIATFTERHSSAFEIRTFEDPVELLTALTQVAGDASRAPDAILLDLFCPRLGADPNVLQDTNRRLAEYLLAEKELKDFVDAAWIPIGVEIVDTVRQYYTAAQLPIIMHTQEGLFLLRDELLQQLDESEVGWLLKGRFSPETDRMVIERQILRSGHHLDEGRLKVLIIDDNPRFIDSFKERQGADYDIWAIEREAEVLRNLSRMESAGTFPDVFIVDMYYPRGSDATALERIDKANQKLRELHSLEADLRSQVQESFQPIGMTTLKQIRRVFSAADMPVLVYTQSGMLMLGDQGIQEIERLGGGWLLKDRYDARTEETMILGELLRSSRPRQ